MHKVSALVLTYNESKHIARCLESLTWVDEIVVVDAHSTDETLTIVCNPKASWATKLKCIQSEWKGFRHQRNLALDLASNDWVFVIDADEKCTPELAQRLQELLKQKDLYPAWKIRRLEFFLGKVIESGMWYPSHQDRFFNRHGVRYQNDIHEYPKFSVEPKLIMEPLWHNPFFHPEHFLHKMNKYTTVEARDRVEAGYRTHWFHIIFGGPVFFFRCLFYYGGIKAGRHGVIIALMEAMSRTTRHIKIWQFQNEKDGKAYDPKKFW
jgi:glycosyltransferase involved in cell wall biosynthesis